MNVYLRELRAYRKSTITWVVSLSAIVLMFMAMYPAFSADVESVTEVLANFPEAFRAALNLEFGTFFSVLGFYGYLVGFAILAGAIQAMNLGTGVISKEDTGKTADFLLSKPVPRVTVMTAKVAAVLTSILITNAAFVTASVIAVASMGDEFEMGTMLLLAATMFLVQLAFLALGLLFSVTLPKVKSVVAVSLPTVFGFYILGAIGEVLEVEESAFLTPFRWYDPTAIIKSGSLEMKYVWVEIAFVALAVSASYLIFLKKDIRAAN